MNKLSLIRRAIPNSVTVKAGRTLLHAQHQSPHILFGAGIVGFVSTTVLASRATLRVEEVLDRSKTKLDEVREVAEGPLAEKHDYTEEDALKDRLYIYSRTFVDLSKLYGPTIIVGTLSIAALTKAHTIQNARIGALTAAYAGLDKAYQAYRKRVEETLGGEREQELLYNVREEQVSVQNPDTGKTEDFKRKVIGENAYSMYARFFDEANHRWQKGQGYNYLFLRAQQNYANDLLKSRGHLFLNEVYDQLGFEHTEAGAVVGWIISDDGDNYVDFGFLDPDNPRTRDFVNGYERSVLLDFNVNGVVYDKLPKWRGQR